MLHVDKNNNPNSNKKWYDRGTNNFLYVVEHEVQGSCPGCAGCSLHEDSGFDMCRCYEIEDVTFKPGIYTALGLVENCSDSSPERQILETMAFKHLNQQQLETMFEANWSCSYYGDEVDSIQSTGEFQDHLDLLNGMTDIELLHHVFTLEYGKLIDGVKNATSISLESVSVKNIETPPGFKNRKVDGHYVWQNKYHGTWSRGYQNSWVKKRQALLAPVCAPAGNKYKLIDGCHRFIDILQATKQKPALRKVKVLVVS